MLVEGNWNEVKSIMHTLSSYLLKHCKRILIIDTTNSLNPHHFAYNTFKQKSIFNRIYCVRTPKPYDLWKRLQTTENFIKLKHVESLLINSLSLVFEESEAEEVKPLLEHILAKINYLTKKYNLITLIGSSPHDNENVMKAYSILQQKLVV